MSLIRRFLDKIRRRQPAERISIPTPFGDVSEVARLQCALNMRDDPAIFIRVEQLVLRECGGDWERAKAEVRRRYPEAIPKGY